MKQIYLHVSWSLFVAIALLLCLGSCQSDNTNGSGGALVSSLSLTAQMGDASSRVGMSDGSTFSCYWNGDKFSVYHNYLLNGAVQSMTALEFATTATSGTSATFSYTGSTAYRYNPGSPLYVFSKGTSGYSASVTDSRVSTLSVSSLSNQNGTLADCAKYDALYGSATVDFNSGKPLVGSLSMHHLLGMMNLHLTNTNFSTSLPVTVTLTTSAANMLPSSGNATLAADGTMTQTGSYSTTWSATVTPNADHSVDVYFMTWPFSGASGTLIVSCSDGSSNAYLDRVITLSNFSLDKGNLKSQPLAINSITITPTTYSKLYAWDAINSVPVTVGSVPTNANTTTVATSTTDRSSRALNACKNCPNANEISWYISVPCYWDSGSITGGNTTSYFMANGGTTKAGMWFRKKSGITGYSTTTFSGTIDGTPIALTSALAASLNLTTDYFFLPAAGFTSSDAADAGAFGSGGTEGDYWSSSPRCFPVAAYAYSLYFISGYVYLCDRIRPDGHCLWQAQ